MEGVEEFTLKPGYRKNSMSLDDADRIFSQSLFCKKIYQLIKLDTFQPSTSWIAKAVGVTEKEVAAAVDALLTLGLIERTNSGFAVTSKVYDKKNSEVEGHLAFTEELLSEPVSKISGFANGSFATDLDSIKKFHMAVGDAIDTLMEDSNKAPSKDFVYSISFSSYKDSKEIPS